MARGLPQPQGDVRSAAHLNFHQEGQRIIDGVPKSITAVPECEERTSMAGTPRRWRHQGTVNDGCFHRSGTSTKKIIMPVHVRRAGVRKIIAPGREGKCGRRRGDRGVQIVSRVRAKSRRRLRRRRGARGAQPR